MTEPLNPQDEERYLLTLLLPVTARTMRDDALDQLEPDDFWSGIHGEMWKTAKALRDAGEPITRRALAASSPGESAGFLLERMAAAVPSADMYPHAVREVKRCSRLRRLVEALDRARQRAFIAEDHAQALTWASDELTKLDEPVHPDAEQFGTLLERFIEAMERPQDQRVTPTPWEDVNAVMAGGLHGGRFYVIGARPGEGKSIAAHNLAEHAAAMGHEALIFSLEMGSLEVTSRIVASGARVDLYEIHRRALSDHSYAAVMEYARRARDYPLTVIDRSDVTLPYIKAVCRNHKRRRGLDVVCIDYLQLITSEHHKSREQQVSHISRQLKILARELDVAVVVPAQLNRETVRRANNRPLKSDLRESGGIEADADVVLLLARGVFPPGHDLAGEFNGTLSVYIDKNRHGRECQIDLMWRAHYATIG